MKRTKDAFHKAGFTCREKANLVGEFCELPRANAVRPYGKGQRISRSLSFFTRLDLQGIVCYTLYFGW